MDTQHSMESPNFETTRINYLLIGTCFILRQTHILDKSTCVFAPMLTCRLTGKLAGDLAGNCTDLIAAAPTRCLQNTPSSIKGPGSTFFAGPGQSARSLFLVRRRSLALYQVTLQTGSDPGQPHTTAGFLWHAVDSH